MKKILLLLIVTFLFNLPVYSHSQHAHQYITYEAYKLLVRSQLKRYPEIENRMGILYGSIGTGPWTEGKIVTGAWREDVEDVVFHYSNYNPPTMTGFAGTIADAFSSLIKDINDNNEYYSSVTHFWDPDNGDLLSSDLRTTNALGTINMTVPNAYQKMLKFKNGGWTITYGYTTCPNSAFGLGVGSAIVAIQFEYANLASFLNNGTAIATGCINPMGQIIQGTHAEVTIDENIRRNIAWEILGRMCHLLEDMSVPAHVHRDAHGNSIDGIRQDSYETYFGYNYGYNSKSVHSTIGNMLNPYVSSNPLHYLMYTTAQMADHFGTNGPYEGDGNNDLGGNPLSEEISFLNSMNIASFGNPYGLTNPASNEEIINIRSKMIPQAIRAVAGLLYWFANEAGLSFVQTTTQGTLSNSEVWDYYYPLTGNIYVPAGITLTINPEATVNLNGFTIISTGGVITVQSGSTITDLQAYIKLSGAIKGLYPSVQSAIDAAGSGKTVELLATTYSSSPSITNKSNITLSGQGSNSTIINTSIGITNSYNIQIEGMRIENGVYSNNSQLVYVYGCTFPGSTLVCDYGSTYMNVSSSTATEGSASFAVSLYGGTGNVHYNTIQNFDCGVFLSNSASYNVGDQNIFCNNGADIYAQNGAYAYAISNTYSRPLPQSIYGNVFVTGVNNVCSMQKVSPYQINEINSFDSKLLKDADEKYLGLLRKIGEDAKKEKYDKSKYATDYSKLIDDYKDIVTTEKDKQIVKAALSKLNHLYKAKEDKNPFATYLNVLAADKANQQYLPYIKRYSIWDAVDNNDYNNSISVADDVLKNAINDEDLTCEMLYEKGLVYKYYLKNQAKAEEVFSDLIANHPKHLLARYASSQSGIALKEQQNFKATESEEAVSYSLDNYPNPFNPSTTISYSLPQAGHVVLKVYDVLGREVAELVNGVKEKGKYSVMFNAGKYASGFYVYTIRVNDFYASKKMLLTK